ncbi:MAG TPA: protoporphyrinogen oxidase [Polyangiaceae bacterium]|jgi:oxygen-dependent protoporphyrinogen oxidase
MADAVRFAVVGGGITGLAAARAAVARGKETGRRVEVTVLERSARLGGNLVTEREGGFLLDGGPDSWVITKPQATTLARSLGLGGAIVGTNAAHRRYFVAWRGKLHAVPEGLVLGVPTQLAPLARTRLFSWPGKARMALEPFVRPRHFQGDEDESIAEFATRRLGREAAERLVAPLLGGISAGDASDISVRASFPQLVAMEAQHGSLVRGMRAAARERAKAQAATGGKGTTGSAFASLEGGIGSLVDALVAELRAAGVVLRTGCSVEAVERRAEGWSLRAGGEAVDADRVLVAVPPWAAARLLAGIDARAGKSLASVPCGSTATVFLGYRRADVAHPLDGVGFVVPRAAERPILAGTWVSSKWDGRAPEGHVLVRAFFGGAWGEEVLAGTDDDLVRLARGELRALMGLDAEPVLARVFRFDRATAQMRVGHLALMRSVHERLAALAPGLRVAGGGYDGVGIPDCVRQGEDVARALVG